MVYSSDDDYYNGKLVDNHMGLVRNELELINGEPMAVGRKGAWVEAA